MRKLIGIQKYWRGYRARQFVSLLKKATKVKKKYFLEEEFWETLSTKMWFTIKWISQILKAVTPQKSYALTTKDHKYKSSGAIYSGEWLGGFRHGKGKMAWADGAQFEGDWLLGRANGKGIFTHTKGEIYDGEWRNDKAHGFGLYTHSNGAKYEGKWYQDLQHGKGTESWPDGSEFTGEYQEGRKNGVGKYLWADGACYEGQWADNEIAGYGHYEWSDGRKYLGHWKGNIMDDFGIYTWQDGRMYEGFYLEDKKHGYGVYTWSDQKKYSGWWHQGKQHGLGVFISREGAKRKFGVWEDGKKARWFNSTEEVEAIESGKVEDLREIFVEHPEASADKIQAFTRHFLPPSSFYQARQSLIGKIKELKIPV